MTDTDARQMSPYTLVKELPALGKALKTARLLAGKSQGQLCRALGWERSYYSNLERGVIKNPSFESVMRILDFLGIGCEEFRKILNSHGYIVNRIIGTGLPDQMFFKEEPKTADDKSQHDEDTR